MAESFNSGDNIRALDDDMIKQALKTELGHLKASDELLEKTLKRCSSELNKEAVRKSFLSMIWNKTSLRYCATVVTACLIVLVFIVKFPSLLGNKSASENNASIAGTQTAADAGGAPANPSESDESKYKLANGFAAEAAPAQEPAPKVAPPVVGDSTDRVGIMFSESAVPNTFNSLNGYGNNQTRGNEASYEAFNAVMGAYNQYSGTQFTYDETRVLSVSMISNSGISSDMLRKASDYHEIMANGNYWILPIKNNKGEIVTLLPVFEVGAVDGSDPLYDISFNFSGEMWNSSLSLSITTDNRTTNLLLDRKAIENLVQNAKGVKQITELLIVDINNGRDFMAFVYADGQEYAVPFFTSISSSSLVNGQVYTLREAFDSLADFLDSGG